MRAVVVLAAAVVSCGGGQPSAPVDAGASEAGESDVRDAEIDEGRAAVEDAPAEIGEKAPAGPFTEFDVPTMNSSPWGITVGPDGALWFTELVGGNIGRITVAGVITEYPITTPSTTPNSSPFGIVTGPD